jgi:hypothetical protein
MNSDDRCIFAVQTHPSGTNNIYEFFHDGGNLVLYADHLVAGQTAITDFDYTDIDVDTTWDDVYLPAPAFCSRILATAQLYMKNTAQQVSLSWRTNGQTGTTGHRIATVESYDASSNAYDYDVTTTDMICDSSQIVEVVNTISDASEVSVWVNGWYFPFGM